MTKKCIYCGRELSEENVIDFCEDCGVQVWGRKMFNAIVSNMEDARSRGDLVHNKEEIKNEEIIKSEELNDLKPY